MSSDDQLKSHSEYTDHTLLDSSWNWGKSEGPTIHYVYEFFYPLPAEGNNKSTIVS